MKKVDDTSQHDFFVTYLVNLPLRDDRDTMERPFFSLSKKKRVKPIEYTSQDGRVWVKVTANNEYGMATIWDADILIWAVSQIVEMVNRGETPSRTLRFYPYNLLKAIGRNPKGKTQYDRLRAALDRLRSTSIKTNIRAGGLEKTAAFGWLDNWEEIKDKESGQSQGMELTVPDWLYKGILVRGGVLAIHEDYFLLTGGIDRWLYRVARKHAGMQENGFFCSLPTLYRKSGIESPYRRFKHELRKSTERDVLPEYHLEWLEDTEGGEPTVFMVRRSKLHHTDPSYRWEAKKDRRTPK